MINDERRPGVAPHAEFENEAEHTSLDALLDAAIDAGLAHEMSWEEVQRVIDQLPVEDGCRWCRGRLDRWGESAWRCAACGRVTSDYYRRSPPRPGPNKAEAERICRSARESWARVEARIKAQTEAVA